MKIGEIVVVTSWASVLLILWGAVTEIFPSSFVTWFAFVFFLVVFVLGASVKR